MSLSRCWIGRKASRPGARASGSPRQAKRSAAAPGRRPGTVDVDDVEVEAQVLRRGDLPAVEADAIERLVLLHGLQEPIGARDPLPGLGLVERQPVAVDARLVRRAHQLEIEPGPVPRAAIDDDLDHRERQKARGRRDVEITGPTVADLEHGGPRPDDLLDQNDRIGPRAGAARRQQAHAAGLVAESQTAGRPGLRGCGRPEAKRRRGADAEQETPHAAQGSDPRHGALDQLNRADTGVGENLSADPHILLRAAGQRWRSVHNSRRVVR